MLDVPRYFFVNAMTTVSAVVFLYSPQTTLAAVAVLNMDDAGERGAGRGDGVLIMRHGRAGPRRVRAGQLGDRRARRPGEQRAIPESHARQAPSST